LIWKIGHKKAQMLRKIPQHPSQMPLKSFEFWKGVHKFAGGVCKFRRGVHHFVIANYKIDPIDHSSKLLVKNPSHHSILSSLYSSYSNLPDWKSWPFSLLKCSIRFKTASILWKIPSSQYSSENSSSMKSRTNIPSLDKPSIICLLIVNPSWWSQCMRRIPASKGYRVCLSRNCRI